MMTDREKQANDALQAIAREIKEKLPENMGFALLIYEFGDSDDRRMMYVSNSNREDVVLSMLEFCAKNLDDPTMFGKDV